MEISKSASLIIYRIREKGMEVFMVNKDTNEAWQLPQQALTAAKALPLDANENFIALDPVNSENGGVEEAYAVEGDWHDIPSLKSLWLDDVRFVKDQIVQLIPEAMEKGTFVALKDAFKRVLPHQYEMLKELKDIISDRNSVKNI